MKPHRDDSPDIIALKIELWNIETYIRNTPYDKLDFDLLIERLKEVRERAEQEKEAV